MKKKQQTKLNTIVFGQFSYGSNNHLVSGPLVNTWLPIYLPTYLPPCMHTHMLHISRWASFCLICIFASNHLFQTVTFAKRSKSSVAVFHLGLRLQRYACTRGDSKGALGKSLGPSLLHWMVSFGFSSCFFLSSGRCSPFTRFD